MKLSFLPLLAMLGFSCLPDSCIAAQTFWRSAGVRGGFAGDAKDHKVRQYDVAAVYQLPWELRAGSGWGVSTQLSLAAGVLKGNGDYGLIGSIGPAFSLGKPGFPVEVDIGISAAGLSRDTIGSRDYNGYGQFISHAGIDFRFVETLGLEYRFQHMSNAGFNGSRNPGLNMHLFGLNWYFAR